MSDKSITPIPSKNGNGARTGKDSSVSGADISLKNDVKSLGSDVKGIASDVAREAQKLAESRLDSGKGMVAEGFGTVAGAIRSTGDQLRESPVAPVSGYLGSAADSIQQASKYLENKSVGEVVSDVEDFARREPLIFLGGTFAVGLLLGRFLKASAPGAREERARFDAAPPPRREAERARSLASPARSTGTTGNGPSYGTDTMGGGTTGGNMGAGKLPAFESPVTSGPVTSGPITQGPVSTQSSVGTDLPVETVGDARTPLRTTSGGSLASAPIEERALGEKKPTSVIGANDRTGGVTPSPTGGVKRTDV